MGAILKEYMVDLPLYKVLSIDSIAALLAFSTDLAVLLLLICIMYLSL